MVGETQFMIHQLQVLQREIPLEAMKPRSEEQLAIMLKLFHSDIPLYIEKLRRLNDYEREAERIARTYSLRDVAHEGIGDVHSAGLHLIPD